MNPLDLNDVDFDRYQARQAAADLYRREGFPDFAAKVEREEVDDCHGMRLATWWRRPR